MWSMVASSPPPSSNLWLHRSNLWVARVEVVTTDYTLCVVVFVVTFVVAISANPKYDVVEIVEIFESECVGNAKTKM